MGEEKLVAAELRKSHRHFTGNNTNFTISINATRMSSRETLEVGQCEQILNKTLETALRQNATDRDFEEALTSLGGLLHASVTNEHLRAALAKTDLIWRLLAAAMESDLPEEYFSTRFRLIRGAVILARNLLTVDRAHAQKHHIRAAALAFLRRSDSLLTEGERREAVCGSVFELLANLTVNVTKHHTELLDEVVAIFAYRETHSIHWTQEALYPAFAYIDTLFHDTDILYNALSKGEGKPVLIVLLTEYEKLNLQGDLDPYAHTIIRIFTKLVFHESFLKFMMVHNEPEVTVRYLRASQAVITSMQEWEVFNLTVVLSWNLELFQKTLVEIQEYFESKSTELPKILYGKICTCLDVFSTLSHLEHTRKFLLSYKGVELLISLLGLIHKNVKPKSRLKDIEQKTDFNSTYIDYKSFPHVKSMIIETLTSLVHENFEVQEEIREIHGLELILSNCIIDDNEPFIKERAIVCLRFLLKDNQKNQDFVAKLEAKEVVPNETLDEVGFEVEIVDGKVTMKQKAKIQELK